MTSCVLLGAGGHARVLIDALEACGYTQALALLDRDASRAGSDFMGIPILGSDDLLAQLAASGTRYFAVAVGSVGDSSVRRSLFERAVALGFVPLTIVHPSAVVSRHASIGAGCQILPGAVVNAGARLGENVIVNSGAIVEHDCVVGSHAHIATGSLLASTVSVGEGAHIGAGATVRQCVAVGARAIVGAGAAVIADVAPDCTVGGVPASDLRRRPVATPGAP
jgi:UDP-perosamine 4-acetyltransferase